MQTINAEINIPPEYTVIKTAELDDLKQQIDYDRWWNAKDLKERYGHDLDWFQDNVLFVPKFKERLKDCVKYSKGSGSPYQFEPHGFSKFMKENFREINNE